MSQITEVWTDGACFPNPGRGGWAWITPDERTGSGSENPSTNQKMEMTAVLRALEELHSPGARIKVFTDSMFVIRGCTQWLDAWKIRGWKTKTRDPVKNQDLWLGLDEALQAYASVDFQWVKGHSGIHMNERVDYLASVASGAALPDIEKFKKQMEKWRMK